MKTLILRLDLERAGNTHMEIIRNEAIVPDSVFSGSTILKEISLLGRMRDTGRQRGGITVFLRAGRCREVITRSSSTNSLF